MIILGERYDIVLHADKPIASYWIQVRAMGVCASLGIQQLAILRYKDAPSKSLLLPSPGYYEGLSQGVVSISLNIISYYIIIQRVKNIKINIVLISEICIRNMMFFSP